jgi:nucleotide-binding universal stress UspA family protein
MNLRNLLVQLDGDARCKQRTDFAIQLAKHHDCHLVGLAATGLINMPAVPEEALAQADLIALAWDALRDQAEKATQRFSDACHAAQFKAYEVLIDEQDKASSIVQRAHCSDLVIVSQEDPAVRPHVARGVIDQIVLNSARPTLILPCVGDAPASPKNALVAWDDSREAARAVADALPLLRGVENVHVVAWNERVGSVDAPPLQKRLDALHQWLLWHGVQSEVHVESTDLPIHEAMLSRAADLGSDLIVMGAYGHTRLAERILGGATRGLLRSMTVPVLMSH